MKPQSTWILSDSALYKKAYINPLKSVLVTQLSIISEYSRPNAKHLLLTPRKKNCPNRQTTSPHYPRLPKKNHIPQSSTDFAASNCTLARGFVLAHISGRAARGPRRQSCAPRRSVLPRRGARYELFEQLSEFRGAFEIRISPDRVLWQKVFVYVRAALVAELFLNIFHFSRAEFFCRSLGHFHVLMWRRRVRCEDSSSRIYRVVRCVNKCGKGWRVDGNREGVEGEVCAINAGLFIFLSNPALRAFKLFTFFWRILLLIIRIEQNILLQVHCEGFF